MKICLLDYWRKTTIFHGEYKNYNLSHQDEQRREDEVDHQNHSPDIPERIAQMRKIFGAGIGNSLHYEAQPQYMPLG